MRTGLGRLVAGDCDGAEQMRRRNTARQQQVTFEDGSLGGRGCDKSDL